MKKNRCFKLTALLLAMIMMISIIPSFAYGAEGQVGPIEVLESTELDSRFIESAKILDASNKEVKDLAAADPNGSFTLNLKVKESVYAESDEQKLPSDTKQVIMFYHLENMIAESGENNVVSWEFDVDTEDLIFDWKQDKQTSFDAVIRIYPNYPAENDISGSYVLGTARKSMLGTEAFTESNRQKLFASEYTETEAGMIRPAMDENPVWVLEHTTGNYYTVRSQNTGKYIYISPGNKGNYKAYSLYLVEATHETAQKILVTDVGGDYYSFTVKHTDGKNYAINNSGNDKVGNSAIRGFGCWTYAGLPNEIFKLYSPGSFDNSATLDLSGSWVIANTNGKVTLTAGSSQSNQLNGMKYTMDNDEMVSEGDVTTFTFEHVIRDWYTVRTDAGYLDITKDGVVISSNPKHLLVKTDNNYQSIIFTTGEYINNGTFPTYALRYNGNNVFGSTLSKYENNTRMQLVPASGLVNGLTRALVYFDVNGGTDSEAPSTIAGVIGETIVLPELSGTRNGQEFIGWADVKDFYAKVKNTNHSYHELYKGGSTYTLTNGKKTLYAVYNPETRKVQFGIRKDGIIQDEPNNYPVDAYGGHFTVEGILKEGRWVIDIDSTKPVNGYYVQNNVMAALNWVPSAEQIKEALKKDGDIDFDPETQYIHYYVLKDTSKDVWKVDGVIRNKAKVGVTYNANVPGGETYFIKDMPGGEQVVVGSEILIGTSAGSTKVLRPIREGHLFNGWNTKPDGSGISYSEGHYVKLTENLNLYAQWIDISDGKMVIIIHSDWPDGKLGYIGARITLTAELSGFAGRQYTLQWQYTDGDSENWIDIPGANTDTYVFTLDEVNTHYNWRCVARDVR